MRLRLFSVLVESRPIGGSGSETRSVHVHATNADDALARALAIERAPGRSVSVLTIGEEPEPDDAAGVGACPLEPKTPEPLLARTL